MPSGSLSLTTHDPATEQKTPQTREWAKIPAQHTNSPYGRGSTKYPENTRKITKKYEYRIFFQYSKGYLKGYFGESHVLYVGRYFCILWAFLFCSWSRGCQVCPPKRPRPFAYYRLEKKAEASSREWALRCGPPQHPEEMVANTGLLAVCHALYSPWKPNHPNRRRANLWSSFIQAGRRFGHFLRVVA